jgi:hypothetical protein
VKFEFRLPWTPSLRTISKYPHHGIPKCGARGTRDEVRRNVSARSRPRPNFSKRIVPFRYQARNQVDDWVENSNYNGRFLPRRYLTPNVLHFHSLTGSINKGFSLQLHTSSSSTTSMRKMSKHLSDKPMLRRYPIYLPTHSV